MTTSQSSRPNRGPLFITIVIAVLLILCVLVIAAGGLFYQSSQTAVQITKQAGQLSAIITQQSDQYVQLATEASNQQGTVQAQNDATLAAVQSTSDDQAQQIQKMDAVLKQHDTLFAALTATAAAAQAQPTVEPTANPGATFASVNPTASAVKFYQCDNGIVTIDQRQYATSFNSATVKYICFEVTFTYSQTPQKISFQILAEWLDANGKQINQLSTDTYFDKGWTSSYHTDGLGSKDGGVFKPGTNTVNLYVDKVKVASGTFTVK